MPDLIQRIEQRRSERLQDTQRAERQDERKKFIDEHQDELMTHFWCGECGDSLVTLGKKVVQTDWNTGKLIAQYNGECERGHIISKRITDKTRDDYYRYSDDIKRERYKAKLDMLTPDDYGFRTLYGNKYTL